jgi:hypothetical protein
MSQLWEKVRKVVCESAEKAHSGKVRVEKFDSCMTVI